MDPDTWRRLEDVFFAALERPPAERAALLERECAGSAELRAEVEQLLAAHESGTGLAIERSLLGGDTAGSEAGAGMRAGPWRLVRRLGEGGMGDVWLAERAEGEYHQLAAVKLVRAGWRPAELLARFRRERQLLARLVHPNIARLLDGGTTESGEPYLAMEYVEGEPIAAWCRGRGLSLRQRLELFLPVCDAVRFAHANLVVHRDLKPANILVTADGRPVLLDFGIAKLLAHDETDAALTQADDRLLTPEYAAPEQLRGEPVTAATDVWGLGVLLYELLSGARPFRGAGGTRTETERRVLETEPAPPSSALAARAAAGEPDARAVAPGALRGDLDAIVMMALRKEPERRYPSAEQLGEDVRRWLGDLPVRARPESVGVRMRKYVRRHRAGVVAASLLGLSLLAFGIVATFQARRIAEERDRALAEEAKSARTLDVLVDLFQTPDPKRVPGGDTLRMSDVLRLAEPKIEAIDDQPEVQSRLWGALAAIHASRSELRAQRTALERAIAAARRAHDPDLELIPRRDLAVVISRLEGAPAAESAMRAVVADARAVWGPNDDRLAAILPSAANLYGTPAEKRQMLEQSLAIYRRLSPAGSRAEALVLNDLGSWWADRGKPERAVGFHERALAILLRLEPPEHPDVLQTRHDIAMSWIGLGRYADALRDEKAILPVRRRVMGPRTTGVAGNLTGIGYALVHGGRHSEAADSLLSALDIMNHVIGPEGHAARNIERWLTLALARAGREREAAEHWASVERRAAASPGGTPPEVIVLRMRLAALRSTPGHRQETVAALLPDLARVRAGARGPRPRVDALLEVGSAELAAGGSVEDARALLAEAVALADTTYVPEHPERAAAHCGLWVAEARAGGTVDRAALRAAWDRCRDWGLLPPGLPAAVTPLLAGR